jgi:type II secretory pathway component GspD/PulD (secretin)
MQFGSSLINVDRNKTSEFGATTANTRTIGRNVSLTVPAVTYSLNIANSSDGYSHIQARPTLLAYDGQTSKYFDGGEFTYAADGSFSSMSYSKEIGLTLQVTPTFGPNDVVNLKVHAELSNYQPTTVSTFKEALQIGKASTDISADLTYGQTMVISGGASTTETGSSAGVPLLRSVPLVQNLFATKTSATQERSLLMLLTLRRPTTPQDRWASGGPFDTGDANPEALDNLRARYAAWFSQPSTLAAILNRVSRQGDGVLFRPGDVRLSNPAGAEAAGTVRNRFLEDVVTLFYY